MRLLLFTGFLRNKTCVRPSRGLDPVHRHHVADHAVTGREHPVADRALMVLQLPVDVRHVSLLGHVVGKELVTVVAFFLLDLVVNNSDVILQSLIRSEFQGAKVAPETSYVLKKDGSFLS